MKFTIRFLSNRKRWELDYRINGGRHRPTFKSKGLAEAERESVKRQVSSAGTAWMSLKAHERDAVMGVVAEVKAVGLTVRDVWESYKRGDRNKGCKPATLSEAYDKLMAEYEVRMVSKDTRAAIKSNVGRFVIPLGMRQVSSITRDDVFDWLKPYAKSPRTYNTYLTSLNTFFRWCCKPGVKYISEPPTAAIDKIDERRMGDVDKEPAVLTYDQCKALLKATLEHDKRLAPYVANCLFGGLRPEREAGKLQKVDIVRRDNGVSEIVVRGLHAKDRQRRFVKIPPVLGDWLELGGDFPPRNLRRRFENVRLKAGLIKRVHGKLVGWEHDCLRHTFASCSLVLYGAENTINQLGHGDYEMLFGHYRALMTQQEAERIFSLTPEKVLSPDDPGTATDDGFGR